MPLKFTRRETLVILSSSLVGFKALQSNRPAWADDVSWLSQVTRVPAKVPDAERGHFEPL
jgi:hypothetical protein